MVTNNPTRAHLFVVPDTLAHILLVFRYMPENFLDDCLQANQ